MSTPPKVRKGQAPAKLEREAFLARFEASFRDPRFDAERPAIARIAEIAWNNYRDARKAPHTVKAGAEFADPSYELSAEWLEARNRIRAAEARQRDAASASRILLIVGSPRNDGSCPGENSKSFTLARVVDSVLAREGIE